MPHPRSFAQGESVDTGSGSNPGLFHRLDAVALCQHRDPISFFAQVEGQGFWSCLWPYRLGLIGVCAGGIALIAWRTDPSARAWVIAAPILFLVCQIALDTAITIPTGTLTTAKLWLSFWSLYGFSAPVLCLLLLSAVSTLSFSAFVVVFLIGLPLFLVFMAVDAAALLVHLAARRAETQQRQFRSGGPAAHRLEIGRQKLVFWVRLSAAALFFLATLGLLLRGWADNWQGALFLGVAGAATLRSEATLLALCGLPLAWFDRQGERWRSAYAGRNGLFLPTQTLLAMLRRSKNAASQSAILMALLTESAASPSIARGLTQMKQEEVETILLHLSLLPGAADALRLVVPHLSPAQAELSALYAELAQEAAKPLDLQRWLKLLTERKGPTAQKGNKVLALLDQNRMALAAYTDDPQIDSALVLLQEFTSVLEAESVAGTGAELPKGGWPHALLCHLRLHQRALAQSSRAARQGRGNGQAE